MLKESNSGLGVAQYYGARVTGDTAGVIKTEGAKNEATFSITGFTLDHLLMSPFYIPEGSVIRSAYVRVSEAFDLAATSVVNVGTSGEEATNGVVLTEADLETAGFVDLTSALAGTWDAEEPLAEDTEVGIAFSAGSVTDKTVGQATLVVEYVKVA